MAPEDAVPVKYQRDIALRALPRVPAGTAREVGRPAAPVDQQDRLAALARHLGERLARPGMKRAVHLPPHVDDLDRWQAATVDPVGELEPLQFVPALRARRRGPAEQHST